MKQVIFFFFIFLISLSIDGQQLILQPDFQSGNDSYIWSINQETIYGDRPSIFSYTWTHRGETSNIRGLLKFDLNEIPEGSVIENAYLTLYWNPNETTNGIEEHSGQNSFWIERAISPWHENNVNWAKQPQTTMQNRVSVTQSTTSTQDYVDINISDLLKDMIANPSESYGFVLKMQNERNPYSNVIFASSDHPNQKFHPTLKINYTLENENCVKIRPNSTDGQDSYIWDRGIFNNYADNQSIYAYSWTHNSSPSIIRSFINFNLDEIPENVFIKSAKLSLFYNPNSEVDGVDIHSGENDFFIERITSSWNENSLNWSNQPSSTIENRVEVQGSIYQNQDYLDMNVKDLLIDILENPSEGYGFLLKMKKESYPYSNLIFASSDHPNPTLHPLLEVCYSTVSSSEYKDPEDMLSMFPNPAQETIQFENISNFSQLNIYNIEGRLVQSKRLTESKNTLSLDIEYFQKGIYFVELVSAKNGIETLKLIKL